MLTSTPLTVDTTSVFSLYSSTISSKTEQITENFETMDSSDSARTVQRVGHSGLIPKLSGDISANFISMAFFFLLYWMFFLTQELCQKFGHNLYRTASILECKIETVCHAVNIHSLWLFLLNLYCNAWSSAGHFTGTVIALSTAAAQRKRKAHQNTFD